MKIYAVGYMLSTSIRNVTVFFLFDKSVILQITSVMMNYVLSVQIDLQEICCP